MLFDFQFSKEQKEQNDSESSMYFLRSRYYDPSIGRFISRDPVKGPLTLPQSQNPYAYALNNPVNLSDPSGEQVTEFIQMCVRAATTVGTKAFSLFQRSAPAAQRGTQNPIVKEAARKGQEIHKAFEYPAGYIKEKTLESGLRPDAINYELKKVIELKPDNPSAIHRGQRQLQNYLEELNLTEGSGWMGEIWTYPR